MIRKILTGGLLLVCLAEVAHAFDGHREGFVIGAGLAYSPSSHWSAGSDNSDHSWEESKRGWGWQIMLGRAYREKDVLGLELSRTSSKTGFVLPGVPAAYSVHYWFCGPVWSHYYGRTGKSLLSLLGVGLHAFSTPDIPPNMCRDCANGSPFDAVSLGLAYVAGLGYEFTNHLQFVGSISGGKTDKFTLGGTAYAFKTLRVNLQLSILAY